MGGFCSFLLSSQHSLILTPLFNFNTTLKFAHCSSVLVPLTVLQGYPPVPTVRPNRTGIPCSYYLDTILTSLFRSLATLPSSLRFTLPTPLFVSHLSSVPASFPNYRTMDCVPWTMTTLLSPHYSRNASVKWGELFIGRCIMF